VLSDYLVKNVPETVDEQVGNEILKLIPESEIDVQKTKLVQEFFNEIVPDSKTNIIVAKVPIFNAFALPGNTIVVFDKVLQSVNSYPELAALLAHEYSHVKNRHGMRSLAHEQLRAIIADGFSDGANNSDDFIKGSNKLLTSKKSRGFEKQADIEGLELLRKNKINEQGFLDLLTTIESIESTEKLAPNVNSVFSDYISTHPPTKDRIKLIESKILISNNNEPNDKLDSLFKQITE
jgi:Zn-dependent protease with chaperone function